MLIQRDWTALQLDRGRVIKGHKIGLTSKAMQNAVSIARARLRRAVRRHGLYDAGPIPFDRFHAPRVEVELAFVLTATAARAGLLDLRRAERHRLCDAGARDPGDPHASRRSQDREGAARWWTPSRTTPPTRRLVVGGRPFRPPEADLRWVSALLFRNGEIEETGLAAGVLNHPAGGIAWLANRLAPHDEHLAAGEVVLAGSFTRPIDVRRGDTIHADYGAFWLGLVPIRLISYPESPVHDNPSAAAGASISAGSSTPIRSPTPAASTIC